MKKTSFILIAILSVLAGQSRGEVTINLGVGDLLDQSGAIVDSSAIALAVIDTSGSGLASLTNSLLATNSLLGVNDNLTLEDGELVGLIVGRYNIYDTSGQEGYLGGSINNLVLQSPVDAGDKLYIVWFPTLTTADFTTGTGTWYGVFHEASDSPGSGVKWVLPQDGSNVEMVYEQSNSLFASFQTIPEPSSILLVAFGLFGAWYLRRR